MGPLKEYYLECKRNFPFSEIPEDEVLLQHIIEEMKCMEAEFRVLRQNYETRFRQIMWKKHKPPGY